MAEKKEEQENWGPSLPLEGRIDIFPEKPLPDLSTLGGAAFAARYRLDSTQDLMAIVCTKGLQPRIDIVNSMKMADSAAILRLREGGVVHWPAQNASYYALAFDRPLAGRYWQTLDETHPAMSEDNVNHHFVAPMIKALAELHRMGVMHGAIRPTNIFWRDGSTTAPQIGDGISVPAGFGQPALFETIERAMCQPLGRGPGLPIDDCYAFGVTLAMVVLGYNPFQGLDERAILQAKMEKGTFNSMIGSKRLAASHIELLRGLLMDDARQRWSAEDLEQWMSGRRLTPKSSDVGRRASRHFDIAGKELWQVRPLAAALTENVNEAVKVIENGSLEKWLTRSLGDEERAKSVADAIGEIKEGGKTAHYQEQLVTRAAMALDPAAPIRYRGLSVMPMGVACVLADAIVTGKNLQVISEIITNQFVTLWVNLQKDSKTDLVPLAQQLERVRSVAERTTLGSGLERAVYELNPSLPCLSPMLVGECITSSKKLLAALERIAAKSGHPSEPMDRHIAAYLIARDKRSESLFNAMAPNEQAIRRGAAMLTLFSEMQYRYGPDQLPKLAAWLFPLIEPCIKRFLSKPFQEKVRRQAKEAAEAGNLSLMLRRIDDPDRVMGDEQDFLNARLMYQGIVKEIAFIEQNLKNKDNVAREIGRPVAATLASFLSIILMAVTLGRALLHSLG